MTTKLDIKTAGKWLDRVRRSTSAGAEPVEAEQLGDYAIWLATDFPLSVFTAESAKFVAEQSQFFPKWAVLKAALTDWQSAHPDIPRIAYQPSESLRARIEEFQDGTAYYRRAAEHRTQAKHDWSDPAKVRASVANLQQNASPAFRLLLGKMLGGLVKRHAPENLGMVPSQYHPTEAA
jgi:hypothetical protein